MKFCKCRHPQQAHAVTAWSSNETINTKPIHCKATIHAGQYSYPCNCTKYEETY